ncbi:MAG: N-6 DNA methylase, partial [Candidatus Bipolaricaulota bacterium]|nr:N-6 DNA methylase [Candidatus Bipolaricaulota bacterium]
MRTLTVRLEGGILGPDVLERLPDLPGQSPKDFGLTGRRTVLDLAGSLWEDAQLYWESYKRRLAHAGVESATTVTREAWIVPLLEALGYRLTYQRSAAVVDGAAFPISHRDGDGDDGLPVHIVGSDQDLGRRPPAGRGRLSPHALLQEYLNRSEHLWGIVTNGHTLRILRQAPFIARQAYIEFDLQTMLEGEHFDEFLLFLRLAHRSRLPKRAGEPCLLEDYHQQAIEQGGRIRDKLRDAVEVALVVLGNGFLRHPRNEALREKVREGGLSARDLYRQLLHLVYRLFFLLVAEERGLLSESPLYRDHYSLTRLQALAASPPSAPERFSDLYLSLRTLFHILRSEGHAETLGLPPLNGELFSRQHMEDLEEAELSNKDLLRAVELLSYFEPERERVRRRVNYAALDVEELGSVYESLLDLEPVLSEHGGALEFEFGVGTERKSTGSYYTPRELVHELVESALVPVLQDRLQGCRTAEEKEQAILSLKVCDPACGSGHFLLAAARRLGRELARVRTGEEEPSPEAMREAVREVIAHCIYGVDKNPLAVELCKVALWIEGHTKGRPLTFLDHRIRCGDSLVGVMDLKVLEEGIPDEAYTPVTGDDRAVAAALKKDNRAARKERAAGFLPFDFQAHLAEHAAKAAELGSISDDRPEDVNRKAQLYGRLRGAGTSWDRDRVAADLWTAAFFAELTPRNRGKVPTSEVLWDFLARGRGAVSPELLAQVEVLAERLRFFHWPLEFPEVFSPSPAVRERDGVRAGFDVVLGNPPWERIKLQEQEFFATRDREIAEAANKAARAQLIRELPTRNPALWAEYLRELHDAEALSVFLRESGRFPLTARGDINTYSVFAELGRRLIGPRGRAGMVVPTGIATDDTNKVFFADLVGKGALASLFDFENRQGIFPAVDSRYKFSLLTMRGAGEASPMEFAFFATRVEHLRDGRRRFALTPEDFARLNPNTRTCPIFRTRQDAELTKAIYRRVPVLVDETLPPDPAGPGAGNPWGIKFSTMFHMSNDSGHFRTRGELEAAGYVL